MKSFDAKPSVRDNKFNAPSEELRIGVTFKSPEGLAPTKFAGPLSTATVRRFVPDPIEVDKALYELARLGFKVSGRGPLTASVRGSRALFEKVFGTTLTKHQVDTKQDYAFYSFYFPPQGAPWNPNPAITDLIDDAYIQWPHIYMASRKRRAKPAASAGPSVTPPQVDYHHLEVPQGVTRLLNADRVHQNGTTGKNVRVVMVDSGFAQKSHPYFSSHGYNTSVDLAPHAVNDKTDLNGHGTGESANVLALVHCNIGI